MSKVKEKNLDMVLAKLGIDPSCSGYFYIRDAVEIVIEDKFIKFMDLYNIIGKRYGKPASSVERAMRHAIEKAFNSMHPDVIERFWGNTLGMKDKPTVTQFIVVVAINYDEHYELFLKD